MIKNEHRVVVTGLGAVTPLGNDVASTWAAMCQGKSGVGLITQFDHTAFACHIAAEVKDFKPELYMDKKEARRFERFIQFGVAAGQQAVTDASLDMAKENAERVGVIIGSGIGGLRLMEEQHGIVTEKGPSRISPFLIPMLIVNMAAGQVSIKIGARGPNSAVCTACASGSNAIGDAFRILQRGDADVMIAGGTESTITPLGIGGFCAMGALSMRNDDPEHASRPFDKDRDGFIMGEGAGIVVLESLEHAQKRNARIYAELIGYGMSGDAYHITSPSPGGAGASHCMKRALNDAGIAPEQIRYINAHGTSTSMNDRLETMAVKNVFGDSAKSIPMSSTKSTTGHLLGASGGVEFIATVLALVNGTIPPTANLNTPDPECDLDYVPHNARKQAIDIALSNSFGFGGHNATLVVKKFPA